MKKVVLAAALSALAPTAFAGNPSDPIIEPPLIVEHTTGTSCSGILLPLVLLALVAAAVAD